MPIILKCQEEKIGQLWIEALSKALKTFLAGEITAKRLDAIAFDAWNEVFSAILKEIFEVYHEDAWRASDQNAKIALAETILPNFCLDSFKAALICAYDDWLARLPRRSGTKN